MELRDFILTPIILLIIVLCLMLFIRHIRKDLRFIFIFGLFSKIISGMFLGVIYQFYYSSGDTFSYFNQAKIINKALVESPIAGMKLLFLNSNFGQDTFKYSSQIYHYHFPSEYLLIKITSVMNILTFETYSSTSILFSLFSFSGLWALYRTFLKMYPNMKTEFAVILFGIPSFIFWGSGLLKESIILGLLGWLFHYCYVLFIEHRKIFVSALVILVCCYLIYVIKIYILLSFLPPLAFWLIIENNIKIKNKILRFMLFPLFLTISLTLVYLMASNITKGNEKYDLSQIAKRVKINAEWLYYVGMRDNGSTYYLGELDGSLQSVVNLAPSALWVALFRPYLWEAKNSLMVFSSIEALIFLLFTIYVLARAGPIRIAKKIVSDPFIVFCLTFSLVLAIASGITSYNFGTLVRYKIPFLPFYIGALFLMLPSSENHN